ncbi:MAG: hypothetical protein Kow0069_03480 [Promethearchaeota archaeon]
MTPGGHHDRPDLAGEHPRGDAAQLVLLAAFFATWVTDSFLFHYSTYLARWVPPVPRTLVGVASVACFALLERSGLKAVFGDIRNPPRVVTKGPFTHCRHPIYLGEVLLYFGLAFAGGSLASLALAVTGAFLFRALANHEERLLLNKFGEEYARYAASTPKWLPVPWRRHRRRNE